MLAIILSITFVVVAIRMKNGVEGRIYYKNDILVYQTAFEPHFDLLMDESFGFIPDSILQMNLACTVSFLVCR